MAIEEPKYTSVLKEPQFEVRDYGASIVAEVVVTGNQGTVGRSGFRRLARYIFGANKGSKRIAMTAPVTIRPQAAGSALAWPADKAAMSADWAVWFTMPASYKLADLPEPESKRCFQATAFSSCFAA